MTAFGKIVGLLLIVIATTGSPAWCWGTLHAPLTLPDQPASLSSTSGEGGLPVFLASRSTPVEMSWLARRMPLAGLLVSHMPVATTSEEFPAHLQDRGEWTAHDPAAASLICLHSQLTV